MKVPRLYNGYHILNSVSSCDVAMVGSELPGQYYAVARTQPVHSCIIISQISGGIEFVVTTYVGKDDCIVISSGWSGKMGI